MLVEPWAALEDTVLMLRLVIVSSPYSRRNSDIGVPSTLV